jgi:AraC family transcriptional regulator, regulatory protein of adaptative response / DNA-3-methyladenine glycosylase II
MARSAVPSALGSTACPQGAARGFRMVQSIHPAAAAEALGMRARRAYRPYRIAQEPGRDGPELVSRAVGLIVAGALDQECEEQLAQRLGMSGRHLRRLFIYYLGVTPDGVARSGRAHFARQLLDDSSLSVTEIAYTAGYGSVRQFNREFKRIFHRTPTQLRTSQSSAQRLAGDCGLTLRLWYSGPLDWDALTGFLAAQAVRGVEHVDGRTYRRTVVIGGDPGVIELSAGGHDYLNLRVHLPHWETLTHVAAQARRIASLDLDPTEPTQALAGDLLIGPLLAQRPGVRVPGAWDPFETGVAAIVRHQLEPTTQKEVLDRLVARFGRELTGLAAFGLTHTFPSAEVFAGARTDLQAIGLTAEQTNTLVSFASAADRGVIRFDGSMTADQLITSMRDIPGMSASTARYITLRAGEPDVFPADDPVLKLAADEFAGRGLGSAFGARWHPWQSYAAAQLWAARL